MIQKIERLNRITTFFLQMILNFIMHFSSLILSGAYFLTLYFIFGVERVLSFLAYFKITELHLNIISAIFAFIGSISLLKILEYIFSSVLKKITQKTKNDIDDLIAKNIIQIIQPLKYLGALYITLQISKLPETVTLFGEKLIFIIFSIFAIYLLTKVVQIFFDKKVSDAEKLPFVNASILPFLKKIIIVSIWILGILSLASNLGYNITGLITGIGVLGIGAGLAAQKSIANIFGALTIFLNKPFKLGDYIMIQNHTGTVRDIGLTYITLIDMQGHEVKIPNELIISDSVENFSEREFRRADMSIGLIYDTSIDKMREAVTIVENILEAYVTTEKIKNFRVHFDMFGDFSLNIIITYFSKTFNFLDFVKEKEAINLEIKKQFSEAGLEMAFPTSEMIIKNENPKKKLVSKAKK